MKLRLLLSAEIEHLQVPRFDRRARRPTRQSLPGGASQTLTFRGEPAASGSGRPILTRSYDPCAGERRNRTDEFLGLTRPFG
jgi:hypothetical protein